ncbi:upstream stimulatory factor 2 [Euwallacea fornicatus]|uniref:upstream stimulatory factor 2 n=1 Tax=Euwallacea fornicatus TaxID=995702 RepID=UPI00338F7BA6
MDLLDPLDESNKDEIEEKFVISNMKNSSIDSDDDQPAVEHLAPQTLLETPDMESPKSPDGPMITYRVLQVHDSTDSSDFLPTGSSFSPTSTGTQMVAGANLNGPIYVIGNADSGDWPNVYQRPIAPKITPDHSVVLQVKKRDDKRRATHNEVERRRRDKINNWIAKLSKILPESPTDVKGNGQYDGHSKGGILSKAFEYIIELQATETRLGSYIKENKKLANAVDQLRSKNYALEAQNGELVALLKKHGIEVE